VLAAISRRQRSAPPARSCALGDAQARLLVDHQKSGNRDVGGVKVVV
jgi:hypothetical protein